MTTGRERIIAAIKKEPLDRPAWLPFAGCHGGALIGVTADEYLKSAELIARGVGAAIERYRADGVPVMFDLQIEAEALGCELRWAEDNPPAVVTHPLVEGGALADLRVPSSGDGRIGLAIEATRLLRERHPDTALYGLITGPFTLALHLYGPNIFMDMMEAEEKVHELLAFCREVCEAMAGYYIEAGADVIAVVDPMTSQIGPDQFRQFVTPPASAVFDRIRSLGALGSFFVCGHAQQNVVAMCECGADNVSVDENIPLDFVRDNCLEHDVSFGGNLQLTAVLLLGTPDDARRNAVACMDIAGDHGFILAPGCDLPYAVPPENLEAVAEVVHDEYQREIARAQASDDAPEKSLDMSQYGQSDKVVIDIITLDSEACAPCQYMVESVRDVTPEFEGLVEWREHKIKYREALVFMSSLMVKNIPTICIDGKIRFVSQIPPRDELIAAIRDRIYEKTRLRIRSHRADVVIFGNGGDDTARLRANVEQAIMELGCGAEIRQITDEDEIREHGVDPRQTPALMIAKQSLKSAGRVPETAIIKEWLKDVD